MIQRMLTSAVVAGGVAGLLAALLHFAFLQDKILLAEQYEAGALVHFTTAAPPAPCKIRQKTISPSDRDVPQKNDAIINRRIEKLR